MKPIVVFTTFWEANAIIEDEYFIFMEENKLYRCRLLRNKLAPINYRVFSIALSHPPLKSMPEIKSQFKELVRIDDFCPTYEMLQKYKGDKDWEYYTKKYRKLLKERKGFIKEWVDSLLPDTIYFLCCWENTIGESKCHRQLLYEALSASKRMVEKAFFVYRHGNKENTIEKWNVFQVMNFPVGGSNTIAIDPGTPVTIGTNGLAETFGLSLGAQVGVVESSTSIGDTLIQFNDLINSSLFTSISNGTIPTSYSSKSNVEKDMDDFYLDEGEDNYSP